MSASQAAAVAPGSVGTLADPATAGVPRPGSLPTQAEEAAARKDKVLSSQAAIDLAHEALGQITEPLSVGAHAGMRGEDQRIVTHLFECNLAGYRGWRWAVTLTRPPRGRAATVCEMELLPGEDALLIPQWVPWADRLQPGDITRSDRLPRRETDERLEPGWEATSEDEGDVVGTDALDFGRARVLSPQGVQQAAKRWYSGDHGPGADGVRRARATCATCGFLIPLAGPLRNVFGLCANEWAVDDGRVVSLDHGCGAHSETDLPDQGPAWPVMPSRLDESAMEALGTDGTSIRGGRSQEEEIATDTHSDSTQSSQETDSSAAAAASQDEPGRAEDKQDDEPGGVDSPVQETDQGTPADHEAGGDGRAKRGRGKRHKTVREAPAPELPEQRHAAALDAVAELAALSQAETPAEPGEAPEEGDFQEPEGSPEKSAIPSLADLEANLPFGH